MYGCSGQHRSRVIQLAELFRVQLAEHCFTSFIWREELIDQVAKVESHTCGFQSCLLSLTSASEKEAQSEGCKHLYTPEAGVKS